MAEPASVQEAVKTMLEDDIYLPPGQVLVALSVVGPEEPQKCDQFAIKIRGVFTNRDEADAHIKRLQKFDNNVHIYIADVGKWLVLPPKPDKIADQHYQDNFLDNLMTKYQESQLEARQVFDARKRAVMEQGLDANLLPEEKLPKPEKLPEPTADKLLDTMRSSACPRNEPGSSTTPS